MVAALAFTPLLAQAPPAFELGFEERVRIEDWDNIIDHTDAKPDFRTQYRFRSRLFAVARPVEGLELAAGLLHENRRITRPDTAVFNGREVLVETLYLDYRVSPHLSVRAGRQNLMRGEGFIIFDGTPGDGSRSAYFNAVNLKAVWGATTLETLFIENPVHDGLVVANRIENPAEQNRLVEWKERAYGCYLTVKPSPALHLEAYALHKLESDFDRTQRAIFQPDRRFTTFGARLVNELGHGLTASGELAGQWGREEAAALGGAGRAIGAWGGNARLRKTFTAAWKPALSVGWVSLSGQDPRRADRLTAWNPVFSRWPRWSELYIYSQIPEKGAAYWTNTEMLELELRAQPTAALGLRAAVLRLRAQEPLALQPGATFGTGLGRGELLELRADYTFGPSFKAHAVYEHLRPGSAYAGRDGGHYLRFDFTYTFAFRR